MLSEETEQLARKYFIEELGLPENMLKEASKNMLDFFLKLNSIYERTHKQPTV